MVQTDGLREGRTGDYGEEQGYGLEDEASFQSLAVSVSRLSTLGQDASDYAPAVVREIHQYLKTILDVRDEVGATMLQLMQEINTITWTSSMWTCWQREPNTRAPM